MLPQLEPDAQAGRWRLLLPWSFEVEGGYQFTVPRHYLTDGASIPRFFWRVSYSPFDPVVMTAALEHDWLCSLRPPHVLYDRAARHFRDRLVHAGAVRRAAMYRAVLHFGPRW